MKHLERLAEQIAARNVGHVFGIPGSGASLFLLDALEKLGVRFYLTHFEGSAAMMAGAAGKLSGGSGVAVSIKGPGLTNMLPGLAACSLEAFPVVSISEAYLPSTPREVSHKRIDHEKLLSEIAKFQFFLSPEGPDFETLSALAESEIPGVVHLNIAESPFESGFSRPPTGDEQACEVMDAKTLEFLGESKRPVVIAGTLAARRGWSESLNRLSCPVFSTAAAKGVVNERLPHAAGVFTGVGGPLSPEAKMLPEADLIVAMGLRHNEVLAVKPFNRPSIQVDPLGKAKSFGFQFDTHIEGSATQSETLFNVLSEKPWGLDSLQKNIGSLRDYMLRSGFLPAHVYISVARHFKYEARLVLDTGNFCTIGEHAWPVCRPELYLASGQGRYMGIAIPLGIGASIYDRRIPTVVFTGDGGIGMFVSEIKLAVQNRLPLLVVLLSDSSLGTIRGTSLKKGITQQPTMIGRPSWLKTMEGFGLPGLKITAIERLEDALDQWDRADPLYLEIPFDPDDYQRMTDGIR